MQHNVQDKMGRLLAELAKSPEYAKPIGIMELVAFKRKATAEQKAEFDALLKSGDKLGAWKYMQRVLDVELDEAESRTTASINIRRKLRGAGYKLLGSGADATVWAKDAGTVVKIIMPDDGQGAGSAGDTFMRFYEFCKEHPSIPNLPKFSGREVDAFTEDGKEYIMVTMERLKPIPEGSFEEAMVWILSELATKGITWEKALDTIGDERTWMNYDGMDPVKVLQQLDRLDQVDLKEWGTLFKLMTLLYHRGKINKIGWDLHTENAMMRGGTVVVTDPWFNYKMDN